MQRARLPQLAGGVKERLHLGGHHAEAGGEAEHEAIGLGQLLRRAADERSEAVDAEGRRGEETTGVNNCKHGVWQGRHPRTPSTRGLLHEDLGDQLT